MKRTKKRQTLLITAICQHHKANSRHYLLNAALLLLYCVFTPLLHAEELRAFTEKRMTPPLLLEDMNGKQHSVADYTGHVVMVNFWAGWCIPCIQEIPEMINLAKILEGSPFTILAVNVEEGNKIARYGFVKKMDEHMVILMDKDGKAFKAWEGIGMPSTFIIDPQGIIRYEAYGPVNWDRPDVVEALTELMKEAGKDDSGGKK
jgi:thiol-disulfide isomerase/thioredoxin